MNRYIITVAVSFILMSGLSLKGQQKDSMLITTDSSKTVLKPDDIPIKKKPFIRSLVVPGMMVLYGVASIKSDPLQDVNEGLQKTIWMNHPHHQWHIDNYLQFAPAIAVYGLNVVGVRGKNNFRDRSIIYFMSNVFMNVTVSSVKSLSHELRPDSSDRLSFPSGHTGEAFVSAEFLRQEYKDVSPWYGIAGYITASATGLLRMYNNKHWLSDVIAGAGVGFASTKFAYWIYPSLSKKLFHTKQSYTTILPYYRSKEYGLSMQYEFH